MSKPDTQLRAQMSPDAQRQAEDTARALLARAILDGDALCHGGWSLWAYAPLDASPYLSRQVDLMRQEWAAPLRCDPWTLHPLMNAVDLWWRPVEDDAHA